MKRWTDEEIKRIHQCERNAPMLHNAADHIRELQSEVEKIRQRYLFIPLVQGIIDKHFWPVEETEEPITKIGQEW